MKRIFFTIFLFLFIYLLSVVALNLVPESAPVEPATTEIQLQEPEASSSAEEPLPLSPDL